MASLRQHEAVTSKRDMFMVDPRKLKVDPKYNIRDLDAPSAQADLEELKNSIIANGVRVALKIRVEGDDILVVQGHRRHRATLMAIKEGHEILAVPAVPEEKTSEADRVLDLITSNDGKPLSALEKAEVVRRLTNFGWSRKQISERFGYKSEQPIIDLEALLQAPKQVREAVRDGEISPTTAAKIQKKSKNAKEAVETLEKAREEASETGKTKVSSGAVSRSKGDIMLAPSKVKVLIDCLRAIAQGEGEGSRRARKALDAAGVSAEME